MFLAASTNRLFGRCSSPPTLSGRSLAEVTEFTCKLVRLYRHELAVVLVIFITLTFLGVVAVLARRYRRHLFRRCYKSDQKYDTLSYNAIDAADDADCSTPIFMKIHPPAEKTVPEPTAV